MRSDKCASCGANIESLKTDNKVVCPYCGTLYTINNPAQKAEEQSQTQTVETSTFIPKRPKINVLLCLFLCWLGFVPVVIYVVWMNQKQEEWDKKYGKYCNEDDE